MLSNKKKEVCFITTTLEEGSIFDFTMESTSNNLANQSKNFSILDTLIQNHQQRTQQQLNSPNNNLKQSIVFNTTTSPSKCNNGGNFTTPSQPIAIINLSNSLIEEDNNTLPSIHLDSEESIQQSNDIRLPSISETLSTVLPSPRHSSPIRTVTSNNSNTGTNPFYQHSPVNNYTTFSHISCIDKPFIPNELLLPREHSFHLSGGIRKNTIYQRELRKVKERTKRYLGSWIREQLVDDNELSNIPIVNTVNSSSEISEINNVISFASVKDNEHLPSVVSLRPQQVPIKHKFKKLYKENMSPYQ